MNPNVIDPEIIHEIMVMKSNGHTYREIAEKVGKSPKSVEGVVVRNRHHWARDFNFPEIMHKKRFGAK